MAHSSGVIRVENITEFRSKYKQYPFIFLYETVLSPSNTRLSLLFKASLKPRKDAFLDLTACGTATGRVALGYACSGAGTWDPVWNTAVTLFMQQEPSSYLKLWNEYDPDGRHP